MISRFCPKPDGTIPNHMIASNARCRFMGAPSLCQKTSSTLKANRKPTFARFVSRPACGRPTGMGELSSLPHPGGGGSGRGSPLGTAIGAHQMSATILLPASLVALRAKRSFLPVSDGRQPLRRASQGDEEIAGGIRPAISEAQVISHAPALVAM